MRNLLFWIVAAMLGGCAHTNDFTEVTACDTPPYWNDVNCKPCPTGYELLHASVGDAPNRCQRIGSHPNFYPGTPPNSCKVSDGYCYHRYIMDDKEVVDVYIWTPHYGWSFHHRENEHGCWI